MRAWRAGAADGAQPPCAGERAAHCDAAGSLCGRGLCIQYIGRSQSMCHGSMDHGGGAGPFERDACAADGQSGHLCAQWDALTDNGDAAAGGGDVI